MEDNKVGQLYITPKERIVAESVPIIQADYIPKPSLSGIIYGEIVFWATIIGLAIAVPGFILYMTGSGYLDNASLLTHLWQGSDCHTIWKEVGNLDQPLRWYESVKFLNYGDMLATLGIAGMGIAAVIGMWGAFIGTLRSKAGIYIWFALTISIVLTLSSLGILKLH